MCFRPVTGIKKAPRAERENNFAAKLKVVYKREMQNLYPRIFQRITTLWKLRGIHATDNKQKGTCDAEPPEGSFHLRTRL